jgi:hypothetical protein
MMDNPDSHDAAAVAAAWSSTLDPETGKTYYYNTLLKTSSWTDPSQTSQSLTDETTQEGSEGVHDGAYDHQIQSGKRKSVVVKLGAMNWGATETKDDSPKADDSRDSVEGSNPYFQNARLSTSGTASILPPIESNNNDDLVALPHNNGIRSRGVSFANVSERGGMKHQSSLGDVDVSDVHPFDEDTDAGSQRQRRPQGPVPPPAPSVPVDALARAGERSSKWLEYVKRHLLLTEHVADAGIFDLRNCARWCDMIHLYPH